MNNKIKRIDEFKDINEITNTNEFKTIQDLEFKDINEITNTNEFKTIQDLLDKYMDGATSNEEEARLRKYFEEHGNDIPEEWESYRALFSYIGFEQMDLSQILKEDLKEEKKEENFEKKDIAKENIEKKEEGEMLKKKASPDFVTFLRHACKCLIIKNYSYCIG